MDNVWTEEEIKELSEGLKFIKTDLERMETQAHGRKFMEDFWNTYEAAKEEVESANVEFINTAIGKEKYIEQFMNEIRNKIISEVAEMPNEWNGYHIRALFSEIGRHEAPYTEEGKAAVQEVFSSEFYKRTSLI